MCIRDRCVCVCVCVCNSTMKHSINTHTGEYKWHCCLGRTQKKSAIVEHKLSNEDHTVLFGESQVLSSTWQYFAWLQREAVEIYNHGNCNINKKEETCVVSHKMTNRCLKKCMNRRLGATGVAYLIRNNFWITTQWFSELHLFFITLKWYARTLCFQGCLAYYLIMYEVDNALDILMLTRCV